MATAASAAQRLFSNTALERDESGVEDKLDQCLTVLLTLTQNASEKEAIEGLTQHVCRGPQGHEEISFGLMVLILSDRQVAPRYYRDLTLVTRDGLQLFINQLIAVVIERYHKLTEGARLQLVWLSKELIKNNVQGSENVILTLMRQIQGGDLTPRNLFLSESILDILCEHSLWLEKLPFLLATSVYTYLRLIVDHYSPQLVALRQREVEFCSKTLREKFQECSMIGRDLVRLLQNVARIPEFESLWKDLMNQPTTLYPALTGGIAQLLATRTPRRFLQSRVTPEMERKLCFMTQQVKLGAQRRYQDWFHKQYLSTPESHSLRCDLIRYICCIIHPTNEILSSDILPRWALIGWLLSSCTSNVEASNCKIALFYDWLVFDAEKDNIMNIEPGILVMFHSLKLHVQITATLWDFLIRIKKEFFRPLADKIRHGIHTSLRVILEKRVIPSLLPFFDSPRLDNELKSGIRENFAEFFTPGTEQPQPQFAIHPVIVDGSPVINRDKDAAKFSDEEDESNVVFRPIKEEKNDITIEKLKQDIKLAPPKIEEAGLPATTVTKKLQPSNNISNNSEKTPLPAFDECLEPLPDPFKMHVLQLQKEKDTESQCAAIEKIMQDIIECEAFDRQLAKRLGGCFAHVLQDEFQRNVLPEVLNKETLEDAIGTPLFVLLRSFCQTPVQDVSRQEQLQILVEIWQYQPKLSLLLLFYQRVNRVYLNLDMVQTAYRDLVVAKGAKRTLEDALRDDFALCEQGNVPLLCFLVPEVYTQYQSAAMGHSDLLHLVVSVIDATQLQQLCCQCLQGDLTMLNQDNFLALAKASLHWETFEQMAFWSLLQAHRFHSEWLMPLVPLLNFVSHQEACNYTMLIFAAQKPNQEMMQVLLARELQTHDLFVVSLLKHWAILCADVLAEVLATMVVPQKGNKRKRQTKSQAQHTTQQALLHLDELRQQCKDNNDFFSTEPLHSALQHAQVAASESQRSRFAELFALAANDSEEDYAPVKEKTKARSSNRGKRAGGTASSSPQKKSSQASKKENNQQQHTPASKEENDESNTEYDSSTEEETTKPKPPRKRRKQLVSDSD